MGKNKIGHKCLLLLSSCFIATSFFSLSIFSQSNNKNSNTNENNYNTINNIDTQASEVSGSVIGPTEKLTIVQNEKAKMKQGSLVIERDVLPLNIFNPWKDYGTEELETLLADQPDYSTIHIESSHYVEDSVIKNLVFKTDPSGNITYNSIKDQNEVFPNVKRISYVMSESKFESIFPNKLEWYTYELFLKAAQKFPRFCGEKSLTNPYTKDRSMEDVCKMELSMMFTHFMQEVGGLRYVEEMGAPKYVPDTGDSYRNSCLDKNLNRAYPCAKEVAGKGFPNYHGRGSKQLSYSYNYGPYSRVKYGIEDYRLLDEPWLLGDAKDSTQMDPTTLFESAIYFGMVPRGTKPSMHWISSGIWDPTPQELKEGHKYRFHATTNVINGGVECGPENSDKPQAINRANHFISMSKKLGVYKGYGDQLVTPSEDCETYKPYGDPSLDPFLKKGWGYVKHWDGSRPNLVTYENQGPFSMYFPGDYYRAKKSMGNNGVSNGDIVGWEEGKNPSYTKNGENYRQDVAYNEDTGWVSVEIKDPPVDPDKPIAPILSDLKEVSKTNNSLTVSVNYTPSKNDGDNDNATIKVNADSKPLISGTNEYTFSGLEASTDYTVNAKVIPTTSSNTVSDSITITTDAPDPIAPILSDLKEVSKTNNSLTVSVNYTPSKNDGDNDNATIKVNADSKPLISGTNEYTFSGLEASTDYTVNAKVIPTTSSNTVSDSITITTDAPDPIAPILSDLKEVSKTNNSLTVSVNYTPSKNDGDNDNATIKVNTDSKPLISGTNEYTFSGLEASTDYTVNAKVIPTTSSNTVSDFITITTDAPDPIAPILSDLKEVSKTNNSLTVSVNYTPSKNDGDNDNATIKVNADSKPLISGTKEYTFSGLEANTQYIIEANVQSGTTSANETITIITDWLEKPAVGDIMAETRDADFAQSNGSIFNISAEIHYDLIMKNWEGKIIDSNEKEIYLKNPTLDNGKIKFDDVTGLKSGKYKIKINHIIESNVTSEKTFIINLNNEPVVDEDNSTLPTITEGKELIIDSSNLNIFVDGFSKPENSRFRIEDLDGDYINGSRAIYSPGTQTFSILIEIELNAYQVDKGFNILLFAEEGEDAFNSKIFSHSGIIKPIPPSSSNLWGVWWIAGIATGSLAGTAAIGAGFYWYVSKNRFNLNKKTTNKITAEDKAEALRYLESFSKGNKK